MITHKASVSPSSSSPALPAQGWLWPPIQYPRPLLALHPPPVRGCSLQGITAETEALARQGIPGSLILGFPTGRARSEFLFFVSHAGADILLWQEQTPVTRSGILLSYKECEVLTTGLSRVLPTAGSSPEGTRTGTPSETDSGLVSGCLRLGKGHRGPRGNGMFWNSVVGVVQLYTASQELTHFKGVRLWCEFYLHKGESIPSFFFVCLFLSVSHF